MDDLNDIRMALGAISRNIMSVNEKLDDQGATLSRLAELADTLGDVEALITDRLPEALRRISVDPMMGMMFGTQAAELADAIEQAMADRKRRRQMAPPIERR